MLRFSFFSSKEKAPLLLKEKGNHEHIQSLYQKTKLFRNTCEELGNCLFLLFSELDTQPATGPLSWFRNFFSWMYISNELTKIKKLNQKLSAQAQSYRNFLDAAAKKSGLSDPELNCMVDVFSKELGDRYRGAKVLCHPNQLPKQRLGLTSQEYDEACPAYKSLPDEKKRDLNDILSNTAENLFGMFSELGKRKLYTIRDRDVCTTLITAPRHSK